MKTNKNKLTTRVITDNDEVAEVTETGLVGFVNPQDCDLHEELQDLSGYAEELRDRQSQYNGNDF